MNVVIAMAGRGSRLSERGLPKPLIEVAGKPLFAWSTEWLQGGGGANVVVVGLEEHERNHGLRDAVRRHLPDAKCVLIPEVTAGQLCTVLCSAEALDLDQPLLIAPCDTVMRGPLPLPSELSATDGPKVAGIISVAAMAGDRWSFAECDANWTVRRVTEKVRISEWASTGLYYFSDTRRFLADARAQVASGNRVNGEYYVMPLYGRMLERGDCVKAVRADSMRDLGTREALLEFERSTVAA